ncbi:hypothetical protein CL629_00080 [bacterium]|nr:hypothetical protein [bacterium]|tara:strand:- start:4967 stop:5233 length:267 start_codon:yes stop_codon:yes gene_type:complete
MVKAENIGAGSRVMIPRSGFDSYSVVCVSAGYVVIMGGVEVIVLKRVSLVDMVKVPWSGPLFGYTGGKGFYDLGVVGLREATRISESL